MDALTSVAGAVLGPGHHEVVDLLDLVPGVPVDVVRACDDLLPRLAHENALDDALFLAHSCLRPGGVLVAAVPELAGLGALRPAAPPPRVSGDRVTVQYEEYADKLSSLESRAQMQRSWMEKGVKNARRKQSDNDKVGRKLWDWAPDGQSYGLEVVSLVRGGDGWTVSGTVATRHRVLSAAHMSAALQEAGFGAVQRLEPAESGHPLPVWVAVA